MGRGSIRQRGRDSWQLRVYLGTDPDTSRQRWVSRTVHGSQRFARAQLRELAEEAGYAHLRAGTLADLLDRWFEAASLGWALTTVSHTGSVIDSYIKPHLGFCRSGENRNSRPLGETFATSAAAASAACWTRRSWPRSAILMGIAP